MITLSLMLDINTWDIGLDDKGNLQTVGNPYACAQDVATACSTFRGECIYNISAGIPYYENILGYNPGTGAVQTYLENEALRLPYIAQASATVINDSGTRASTGVIVTVDTNGIENTVNL
ncbi:hypothetical protein ERD95_09030 [Enterobacteriaceae bacterium ML5]|nr:hypothetical protein ERD95_09030 [Enterobacteriaceae bacterium ML5]